MGPIQNGEMTRAGSRQGPEVEVLSQFGDVAAKGVGMGIRSCKAVKVQHGVLRNRWVNAGHCPISSPFVAGGSGLSSFLWQVLL